MSSSSGSWLRFLRIHFKTIWIILAPILLSPLLFFGDPARCCYCILLMSCYWVAEVVPLAVTAFLPLIVMPMVGVMSVKKIANSYLSETNMMFVTSLMLSLAVEECQLHRRIALKMLSFVGTKPQWLMAGFMCITSFISLWISDTACAALMSPIAYALLEAIMIHKMKDRKKSSDVYELEEPYEKEKNDTKLDVSRLSARDQGICKCIMLIVAHASLIGGTGTINSTGPNLIFRDTLEKFFPGEDTKISYLSWMGFAVPPMVGYMLASWIVVQVQFMGFAYMLRIFNKSTAEEKEDEDFARKAVTKAYQELGPMTFAEKSTLTIFVLTIASWITSDPKVIPGWANLFKKDFVTDTCSGMLAVFILFVWPKNRPQNIFPFSGSEMRYEAGESLISWDTVRRRFPWSIILLLGAGFSISASVKESGLSSVIACQMQHVLSGLSLPLMQVAISVIVVAMTEFSTNSATASIFIPISFNIAESVGAHPLYFSIPSAIGPSFSFMLPMATPANAIVYETNTMRMIDMISCGLFLNVFCIGITVLNMNTWAYWLFDMGTIPNYVYLHSTNVTLCT